MGLNYDAAHNQLIALDQVVNCSKKRGPEGLNTSQAYKDGAFLAGFLIFPELSFYYWDSYSYPRLNLVFQGLLTGNKSNWQVTNLTASLDW